MAIENGVSMVWSAMKRVARTGRLAAPPPRLVVEERQLSTHRVHRPHVDDMGWRKLLAACKFAHERRAGRNGLESGIGRGAGGTGKAQQAEQNYGVVLVHAKHLLDRKSSRY